MKNGKVVLTDGNSNPVGYVLRKDVYKGILEPLGFKDIEAFDYFLIKHNINSIVFAPKKGTIYFDGVGSERLNIARIDLVPQLGYDQAYNFLENLKNIEGFSEDLKEKGLNFIIQLEETN